MMRTSTLRVSDEPSGRISPSCSTRSSRTCMPGSVSPISSRKIVPLSAISKRPFLSAWAPVKAPRLWPNSSLSSSVSGSAPQFCATKPLLAARARVVDGARHQVLAGTGLAREQHRGVGLRDLLHHVEHAVHGRARADHRLEGVAALDLAPQVEVLGAQPLVGVGQRGGEGHVLGRQRVGLEGASHVDAQALGLPGLLDVAVDSAVVDGAHDRGDVRVAGQHHAHGLGPALDDLLEELDAAHVRHHLVDDHERDVLALQDLEPLLAGQRREDPVVVLQGHRDRLDDRLLVVDHEDAVALAGGLGAGALDQGIVHGGWFRRCRGPGSPARAAGANVTEHRGDGQRPVPRPTARLPAAG